MAICRQVVSAGLGVLAVASIASATDITGAVSFVGITPCRIVDTRTSQPFTGQAGPPSLVANATRTFQITGTVPGVPTQCGIPTTAVAISVNFTVTGFTAAGDLRVFPAGATLPLVSILNYQMENIANATSVPLGPGGISIRADSAGTDFIADVNGYYVPRTFTTLESGKTLKGVYFAGIKSTAAGDFYSTAFTFQVPLASGAAAPAANFIASGGAATANCPGTAANPLALAGQLCLYESTGNSNRTLSCLFRLSTFTCSTSDTFGGAVALFSVAAGTSYSSGTWAVTAP
jgi:hypothetical protein